MTEEKLYETIFSLLCQAGVQLSCVLSPSIMLIPNDKQRKTFYLLISLFFGSTASRSLVADTCKRTLNAIIPSPFLEDIVGGLQVAVFLELNEDEKDPRKAPFRKVGRIVIRTDGYNAALHLTKDDLYPGKSTNDILVIGKWWSNPA